MIHILTIGTIADDETIMVRTALILNPCCRMEHRVDLSTAIDSTDEWVATTWGQVKSYSNIIVYRDNGTIHIDIPEYTHHKGVFL